jgi:hypothetical protein
MSSRAVRQWFRTFLPTAVPTLPYVETVNSAPNPQNLPDAWATLEFPNASEQRLTLGTSALFREYGMVNVIVLGLSGRGDDTIMEAAEAVRSALQGIAVQVAVGDQFGTLRIDAAEPPNTDATESGNWFLASVSCSYTFDVVRAAS